MSGILGSSDIPAATDTTVYEVPTLTIATVNINLCNRGTTTALIRIAAVSTALTDADYVEFDFKLCANDVIERTGIVLSAGQSIVVRSDIVDVSAQVWGWEENV